MHGRPFEPQVASLSSRHTERAWRERSRTSDEEQRRQRTAAKTFVDWQVAQLQRLIGEKDTQISDVKAKSRDLQVNVRLLMTFGRVVRVDMLLAVGLCTERGI